MLLTIATKTDQSNPVKAKASERYRRLLHKMNVMAYDIKKSRVILNGDTKKVYLDDWDHILHRIQAVESEFDQVAQEVKDIFKSELK